MKKNIILVLITAIIFTGVGALATTVITADKVNYDENTTVKDKLDSLYTTATDTVTGLNNQIDSLTATNSSLEGQVDTLTAEKNTLLDLGMKNRILFIYTANTKTSSWTSKSLGYGFYQNGKGYLSQELENNLYYLRAVKACKIRATLIIWNPEAANNTPQIKLYKNNTEVLSVSNTKNTGNYKAQNIELTLAVGDKLNYSTYGAGNSITDYLVYFEFLSE